MRIFLIIFYIIILLFLQISIFPHLAILGVYPNLILVSILAASILWGWKKAILWVIIGGLFTDIYSLHNVLGMSIFALLVVAYLSYFLSQNTFKKATLFSLVSNFLITIFVYNILLIFFLKIFEIGFEFNFFAFFIGIIYNLVFAIPIFYLFKKYASQPAKIQN